MTDNTGTPNFVLKLEPNKNQVVIGKENQLERYEVELEDLVWSSGTALSEPIPVEAKIRYNMTARSAVLHPGTVPKLVFKEPVRAIAPGQMAVAYKGETVLAGGVIRSN
jgi:tRNA-specific 2-thiouridylase